MLVVLGCWLRVLACVGNGCARTPGKARPWSVAGVNPDNAACTTGETAIVACSHYFYDTSVIRSLCPQRLAASLIGQFSVTRQIFFITTRRMKREFFCMGCLFTNAKNFDFVAFYFYLFFNHWNLWNFW